VHVAFSFARLCAIAFGVTLSDTSPSVRPTTSVLIGVIALHDAYAMTVNKTKRMMKRILNCFD